MPKLSGAFIQSGAARAAVLSINDGLVTNISLILGIVGATATPSVVQLAGLASSQPQPRRLPVTSHPSWPCPAARACGLPAANRAGQPLAGRGTGWEDAGGLRSPGGAFPTGLWHNSV
jgi:hypothetical protein